MRLVCLNCMYIYLAAEILELSGNTVHNKTRINPCHLQLVVHNDKLNKLFGGQYQALLLPKKRRPSTLGGLLLLTAPKGFF